MWSMHAWLLPIAAVLCSVPFRTADVRADFVDALASSALRIGDGENEMTSRERGGSERTGARSAHGGGAVAPPAGCILVPPGITAPRTASHEHMRLKAPLSRPRYATYRYRCGRSCGGTCNMCRHAARCVLSSVHWCARVAQHAACVGMRGDACHGMSYDTTSRSTSSYSRETQRWTRERRAETYTLTRLYRCRWRCDRCGDELTRGCTDGASPLARQQFPYPPRNILIAIVRVHPIVVVMKGLNV